MQAPGNGALDDPSPGLHDEASVGAPDDLGRTRGRRDARTLVASIREDALEEWEALDDAPEDQRRAVAILHAGRMHIDDVEQDGAPIVVLAPDPVERGVGLPPHITYEQAKNFAKSVLKGDADAYSIVKQSHKRSWT